MRWTKHFIGLTLFGFGASFSPAPAEMGSGDILVVIFAGAAIALGTVVFLLLQVYGNKEFCRLNLPPGPPSAWTLPKAA
jgi:hypothetical protein